MFEGLVELFLELSVFLALGAFVLEGLEELFFGGLVSGAAVGVGIGILWVCLFFVFRGLVGLCCLPGLGFGLVEVVEFGEVVFDFVVDVLEVLADFLLVVVVFLGVLGSEFCTVYGDGFCAVECPCSAHLDEGLEGFA